MTHWLEEKRLEEARVNERKAQSAELGHGDRMRAALHAKRDALADAQAAGLDDESLAEMDERLSQYGHLVAEGMPAETLMAISRLEGEMLAQGDGRSPAARVADARESVLSGSVPLNDPAAFRMLSEGVERDALVALDHIRPGVPLNIKRSIVDAVQNGTPEERQAALRLLRDFETSDEDLDTAAALEGIARARGQQL